MTIAAFIPGAAGAQIAGLHQEGLIERAFHDPLAPLQLFRQLATPEEADAHIGTEIFMTRRGLLTPNVTQRTSASGDPTPQQVFYEQWVSVLGRYYDSIDTSLTQSATSIGDQFIQDIQALGTQAGMSVNLLARNALYRAYLGGHTVLFAGTSSGDTTIRVVALNGFRKVVLRGTNVPPKDVSSAYPLQITIMNGATPITKYVVGAIPDDAADPDGPGTLSLSATVGASVSARAPVLASNRPRLVRAGGGLSVDSLSTVDTVVLQDFNTAVTIMRNNRVPPHEDGYYHCHVPNDATNQVFADEVFQRLHTALPDSERYQTGFLSKMLGIVFVPNTECPDYSNAGTTKATGGNAVISQHISAETVNYNGNRVGRCILTGRGAIYERYFDAKKHLVSSVGMTGQQGDFNVSNNGITIVTDRIRLVVRAPMDKLQDKVSSTWDYIGDFPTPSDVSAGGPEHFKRGCAIEFALD